MTRKHSFFLLAGPKANADLPWALPRTALNGWPDRCQGEGDSQKSGVDDLAIFTNMADYLPAFKRLMDTSTGDDMDQLAARYAGFYRYAKILEAVAAGIRSGKIVVRKERPPGDLTWEIRSRQQ